MQYEGVVQPIAGDQIVYLLDAVAEAVSCGDWALGVGDGDGGWVQDVVDGEEVGGSVKGD